jgi:hypothetical protein
MEVIREKLGWHQLRIKEGESFEMSTEANERTSVRVLTIMCREQKGQKEGQKITW